MNRSGGEVFARLAQQLNRARMQAGGGGPGGKGGGPFGGMPGGGKGAATGGGLIALLAVGGIALNYSLFNGELFIWVEFLAECSRWWTSSYQVFTVARCPTGYLSRRNTPYCETGCSQAQTFANDSFPGLRVRLSTMLGRSHVTSLH